MLLLLSAAFVAALSCGKENVEPATTVRESPQVQPTCAEMIVGRWNLEKTDERATPWYRSTVWEFTQGHEWIQTLVYNDGVHYDSIVNHSTWSIEGDSITFVQDNGVVEGLRIERLDGDTLVTRSWYQGEFEPDGAWYFYTFSRLPAFKAQWRQGPPDDYTGCI